MAPTCDSVCDLLSWNQSVNHGDGMETSSIDRRIPESPSQIDIPTLLEDVNVHWLVKDYERNKNVKRVAPDMNEYISSRRSASKDKMSKLADAFSDPAFTPILSQSKDVQMTQAATNFNVDPNNGPLSSYPVAPSFNPSQICTQTGTAVLEASTRSGLIIILPNWAEKLLGWHYPMDPTTQTFGTPEPIYFALDLDQFYEMMRLVCAIYDIQAGTVSTTNAALSGSFNAVHANNSISGLKGNDTSTFQIYSYGNILGLTPDITRRVGACPSWKGVGSIFFNHPRRPFSRLEDNSTFAGSADVDSSSCFFKFIDTGSSYNLTGRIVFNAQTFTWAANTTTVFTLESGKYLVDSLRASEINYAFSTKFDVNGAMNVEWTLGYELFDIADNVINSGTVDRKLQTFSGAILSIDVNNGGSFPTLLNADETNLSPPVRSMKWIMTIQQTTNTAAVRTVTMSHPFTLNFTFPVNNGLVEGLVQNPTLISYDGVEPGTKINVTGALRFEVIADSSTAKFVTPIYRSVNLNLEQAIMKVLSRPDKYGVRFVYSLDQKDHYINLMNSAIAVAASKGEAKILNIIEHLLATHQACPLKKDEFAEASVRSLWKKAKKGVLKIGKNVYDDVVKPAAHEAMKTLTDVGKNTLTSAVKMALADLSGGAAVASTMEYLPPRVQYSSINSANINKQGSPIVPRASSGFIPRAWQAATDLPGKKFCYSASSVNYRAVANLVNEFSPLKTENEESSVPITYTFPMKEVSMFPTLFSDKDGQFVDCQVDKKNQTAASIFAIVPADRINLPIGTVKTRVASHWIWNYSPSVLDPVATPIDPGKDVAMLRVTKVGDEHVECSLSSLVVTGRSCDLALWAFARKIGHGVVFSGVLENGQIEFLDVQPAAAKACYVCTFNNLPLITNSDCQTKGVINVKELIKISPMLLRMSRKPMRISSQYWHAYQDNEQWTDVTEVILKNQLLARSMGIHFKDDPVIMINNDNARYVKMRNCRCPGKLLSVDGDFVHVDIGIASAHRYWKAFASMIVFDTEIRPLRGAIPSTAVICRAATAKAAISISNPELLTYSLSTIFASPEWLDYQTTNTKENQTKLFKRFNKMFYFPKQEQNATNPKIPEKTVKQAIRVPRSKNNRSLKSLVYEVLKDVTDKEHWWYLFDGASRRLIDLDDYSKEILSNYSYKGYTLLQLCDLPRSQLIFHLKNDLK